MARPGKHSDTGAPRRRGEPSAEFRLIAACCRWPTDPDAVRAAATGVDWDYAVSLANRHRVMGFVAHALAAAGIEAPPSVTARRQGIVRRNLMLHAESVRVTKCLDDAGIAHVFLKGSVVAQLAFGTQSIKQMLDNDILIGPADARAALLALEAAGYEMTDPPRPPDHRLGLLFKFGRECQLVHRATGALLDLHWQLHVHRHLLPEPDLARDRVIVNVEGRPLPALLGEQMMMHLALHGARHRWSRLKWLADFNALLVGMSAAEVAGLRDYAGRHGIRACLDAAMAQCARTFGTAVPGDVLAARRARWLVAQSEGLIFGKDELADQQDIPGRFMVAGTVSALLFRMNPVYWLGAVRDMLVSPGDVLAAPLPRPLHPTYVVVAPAVRVGRAVGSIFRKRDAAWNGPVAKEN